MCSWHQKHNYTDINFTCVDPIPTLEEELEMYILIKEDVCDLHNIFCCEICFDLEAI